MVNSVGGVAGQMFASINKQVEQATCVSQRVPIVAVRLFILKYEEWVY